VELPATDDTIIAVSTGWEAAPLGVVRLSGPESFALAGRLGFGLPARAAMPGFASVRLRADEGIVLPGNVFAFAGPRSYTGQDVIELHTVGSLPLLRLLCNRLIAWGARRALPGEFTARAFLNGKLDAGQVAAILALLHADSAIAARRAARESGVGQRRLVAALRDRLADLLALVEAGIDFTEEEDIVLIDAAACQQVLRGLRAELEGLAASDENGRRATWPHVALAGVPNAGKSTLFNALLGYERAIVSPLLGTTRDVLSAEVRLGGVRAVLQDCAGRAAPGALPESAADQAAERAATQADCVLWIHPHALPWGDDEIARCRALAPERRLLVLSKMDLRGAAWASEPADPIPFAERWQVSALAGEGLPQLADGLGRWLAKRGPCPATPLGAAAAVAEAALGRALEVVGARRGFDGAELIATELRLAWEALGDVSDGPISEAVLERVFTQFCIGK
jgi:tRNA modification GTPase